MSSGFAWLNELMVWLGRWVPRLALIKASHLGVLFGLGGSVTVKDPGLCCYWPIIHELTIVSTRWRTLELCAQLHGHEVIAIVISYRITEPGLVLLRLNDVVAQVNDRAQAALAILFAGPSPPANDQIGGGVVAALRAEFGAHGVEVEQVDVAQRGPAFVLRNMNDWGIHEDRSL